MEERCIKPRVGNRWKGGKTIDKTGYILVRMPQHPKAINGYVREHILVIESALGPLKPGEIVHHEDGDRSNNSFNNLKVFESNSAHMAFHRKQEAFLACGNEDWRKCKICHKYDDTSNMYYHKSAQAYFHRRCNADHQLRLKAKRKGELSI